MTNREFYTAVISANISDEITTYASEQIAALDARNEKRKNTPTKTQIENEEIKKSILNTLTESDSALAASEIATALSLTTQRVSALCRQLVTGGKITVADRKVKSKGTVKEYSLAD